MTQPWLELLFIADVDDDEPSEEEDEHYILGCMIKCQSGYECRYCPFMTCPNERTMRAHVSSRVKLFAFIIIYASDLKREVL